MGKFKDEHGQTRVGKFLRKMKDVGQEIGPEVLDIAGDLTGVDALNRLGDAIDKDEKMAREDKEMALEMLQLDMSDAKSARENITARWKADMTSDSWLSKNIRPLVLAFNWLLIATVLIFDVNLSAPLVQMFSAVSLLVNGAYFGDRAVQKYKSIQQKYKSFQL